MARADSRKANKEKAAKTQKEILAALKKSFSLDNDIVKYITKLYSPTELKKSFDAGKSATTKVVTTATQALKSDKPGTTRAKTPSEFDKMAAELKASAKTKPKIKGTTRVNKSTVVVSSKAKAKPKPNTPAKKEAKNFNVGVSKGGVSFNTAFAHFRKKGAKTFTWNGKKYTTELKKKGKK